MSDHRALYGTDHRAVAATAHVAGPWSFMLEGGALRYVKHQGVEAIRGIAFLVRDRDWGTLSPRIEQKVETQDGDHLTMAFTATYDSGAAQLIVDITIDISPETLSISAQGRARGDFETNRAGFTVLHPIDGVAGQPVRVGHSDGRVETARFPLLIDPWQPFKDIVSLTHTLGEHSVTCQFSGDTFEMEDQRQWGDASFKTYNRPLAKPWPYVLEDQEKLVQSVALTLSKPLPDTTPAAARHAISARFPEMALALTPDEAVQLAAAPDVLTSVNPQRLLCHVDMDLGDLDRQLHAFAAAQAACPTRIFDLELILACNASPATEMTDVAKRMRAAQFHPASVMICPSVDRQSTPPGAQWPDCPPLTDIHRAAAEVFADLVRGGGMVSFFPELNRKRPPLDTLDFVGHGLCPIVHAADDMSVMETLEAIPHITGSARAIFGDLPYRIGPATIAMRQNPYGTRTIPNPDAQRLCMTDDDPRHRGTFGAAYAIGLATALAPANIAVWTPAAVFGPRGVTGQLPIAQALSTLAALAGQPVKTAQIANGMAELSVGETLIIANLTPERRGDLGPYEWRV
ncbi:hypothetical protein [Tritonibacter horizontis]|uniref:Uncharacterized protein n=1 Tax=Tritonibacter horizontis TaxID=1768241 RepID=A0A132C202_9RHOB|nr:hypothetical protein [Tritonibacter horizontis]KUP94603.1 hypothetical protein TRIHO_05290 [Tritonibacter horizontis]